MISRYNACEALLAQLRGVFALTISKRLREGYSFKSFADRLGWSEADFKNRMLFTDGEARLDTISDMAFALGFEITTQLHVAERRSASAIDARSGETAGLDPKGESAVGVAETP